MNRIIHNERLSKPSAKYVWGFIYKQNRILFIGVFIALIIAIAYILTENLEELFVGAEKWFNFLYNLSLSIIAAFIFYSINIIIPNYKKDIIRDSNKEILISEFFQYLDIYFRDIALRSKYCDEEELASDDFKDDYPCGYDELFSFMDDKYDRWIYNAVLELKNETKENLLYIQMIEYVDNILSNYFDLIDSKKLIMYLKLKDKIEFFLFNDLARLNYSNNINIRNNDVIFVKELYLITRDLQKREKIEPQYTIPHFKPRNF